MERNDDYLRKLLLDMVSSNEWLHMSDTMSGLEDEDFRYFHMLLLRDAGFVEEMQSDVFRVTNAGHDFVALTRENATWSAVKTAVSHLSGASVQMLYRVAENMARQKLKEFGVPLE